VVGKSVLAISVDLTERDGSHSGSFEPEAESADTGKEVEDIHFCPKTGVDRLGPMALYSDRWKGNPAR
jgi:hypothetical protein